MPAHHSAVVAVVAAFVEVAASSRQLKFSTGHGTSNSQASHWAATAATAPQVNLSFSFGMGGSIAAVS